jgi:ABC-type branched-subunit amino acid transport system ATPase component
MNTQLEAQNLDAGYGRAAIVRGLNLRVDAGEVVALLGPNGAGKTTTLLTLAGAISPLGGKVLFKGAPTRQPLHRRSSNGLGLVSEERSVFMRLTAAENLRVAGVDPQAALELFPELEPRMKVRAGLLSGGEQQMLTLARALARRPTLLLADELSLGLAPLIVVRLLSAVRSAADAGVAVLLVEQHVRKVLDIADRVYIMKRGRIEVSGSAKEVAAMPGVFEASYLPADTVTGVKSPSNCRRTNEHGVD